MDKVGHLSKKGLSFFVAKRERSPAMSLLELFCAVDDFYQVFEPVWRPELYVVKGSGLAS